MKKMNICQIKNNSVFHAESICLSGVKVEEVIGNIIEIRNILHQNIMLLQLP